MERRRSFTRWEDRPVADQVREAWRRHRNFLARAPHAQKDIDDLEARLSKLRTTLTKLERTVSSHNDANTRATLSAFADLASKRLALADAQLKDSKRKLTGLYDAADTMGSLKPWQMFRASDNLSTGLFGMEQNITSVQQMLSDVDGTVEGARQVYAYLAKQRATVSNPAKIRVAKVELANKVRGGRAVGNLWGVGGYTEDDRRGPYLLEPQSSKSVAEEFAAQWNSDHRFANPAPKNIDHKFAGSLFSVDPTLAMGYLRGSMSKGTARDLAKAKLSKAKRRSNPSRREMTKAEALREFRSAYPAGSFLMAGGRLDRVMAREAWSNFTDSLHRDGRITDTQVDQWGVPPQFSSVRSAMSRRSNPDWAALSAKAREKAKSAYARAKPHAARGLALAKVGAARAGAAVKRGSKKAAPHVARGIRSLSERLDRYAVSNPRKRTRIRR